MNSAEFKTLREACGLSVPDLAKISISPKTGQPVGERTVRYWESGGFNVPKDVIEMITTLDKSLTNEAHNIADTAKSNNLEYLELTRYKTEKELWSACPEFQGLPTSCHAVLLYRTKDLLDNDPDVTFDVFINWDSE